LGASIPQISTTGIANTVYADPNPSVSVAGTDAVIAFTSTDGSATEAASTNLFYAASATGAVDANDNGVPRGLSETQGITNRNGGDLVYNGSITSGTREQLFAAFSDDSNYSIAPGQDLTALNSITFTVIPEPSSIFLSALGLFSLGLYRKR